VVVHARTLELYDQIEIAHAVVQAGQRMVATNLWVTGQRAARVVFGDMGAGVSPYPYALVYPQDEHERLLIERLDDLGVEVERATELVRLEQRTDGVLAHLRRADGTERQCEASYVAGCDGAHSAVREALGIGFPGGTYAHLFYVADVDANGPVLNGEVHVAMDRTDFLVVFPLRGERHARLIGTLRDAPGEDHEHLTWDDVSPRVIDWMHVDVARVNWFSTYRVHHRVADRFRRERTFLVGDAAHVHSPVGGQGMNTGIGDAVNLAWKLAASLHGSADSSILDTYEPERIAFARRLVATTDEAFSAVTSSGAIARVLRLHVAPLLLPPIFAFNVTRRLMFRTISQTSVNYRGSALSEGRAGAIHGGDRLPWVPTTGAGADNFGPLRSMNWQVHVYGAPSSEIRVVCDQHHLPLHAFAWQPAMLGQGMQRDAIYLVRPDGYVALADASGRGAALASYLAAHKISMG